MIEVRRYLPPLVAAGVAAAAGGLWLVTGGADVAVPVMVVAVGLYFVPRLSRSRRHTRLEIDREQITFTEGNLLGETQQRFAVVDIGPPCVGQILVERFRRPDTSLDCLEFPHWLDGVPGGQSLPIQLLIGYDRLRLEWLRDQISRWLARDSPK
jgi:hypothetical protein